MNNEPTNRTSRRARFALVGLFLAFITMVALAFAAPEVMAQRRGGRGGGRRGPNNGQVQNGPGTNNNGNNNNGNNNNGNNNNANNNNANNNNGNNNNLNLTQFMQARTLDGSGNNPLDADLGMAGEQFARVSEAVYADGVGELALEVDPRFVSNRIYNDNIENLFSENGITHWGFIWGQFVDHSVTLTAEADEADEEQIMIPFNEDDPLEEFTNDMGAIAFTRSGVTDGTGVTSPREQTNVLSSYLDASAIYGTTAERLDWLRVGSNDGNPENNSAELLMTNDNYLPLATARNNPDSAPEMALPGILRMNPTAATIAGDVRANENLGLNTAHTLFAREHNRIVDELPNNLPENIKFEIARRVVGATVQFITYNEWLPAYGVNLDPYTGYDPTVDPSIANEFATVGYRAHSMIHEDFEFVGDADDYSQAEIGALTAQGITVQFDGDEVRFIIPLNIAFGRPHLLSEIGLGAASLGLASDLQYTNDVFIDNQLRSVLFQIPAPGAENPMACLNGVDMPDCFTMVNDLGVLDMVRAYDHGIPNYNDLREAYGLERVSTFTEITGESTQFFPSDPLIDPSDPINDPNIIDFVSLSNANGDPVAVGDQNGGAVEGVQRTTVAARLRNIYRSVDNVDAFTGMMAEPHVAGTEFGELQLAMWETQFTAMRDGDRFFYLNDPVLETIEDEFGIDYRQTLAEVIANNTELSPNDLPSNVFLFGQ